MSDVPVTWVDSVGLSDQSVEFEKVEDTETSVRKTASVELLQMSVEEDLSLRVAAMLATANDDLRSPFSDDSRGLDKRPSHASHQRHGAPTSRIYEYILQLENNEDRDEDEWDNDDDNGYLTVQLSEEEFYELEEV